MFLIIINHLKMESIPKYPAPTDIERLRHAAR